MNELPVRRTRFVVPFRFGEEGRSNRDYIRFMDKKTDRFSGKWVEDSILAGEQDLYPYILHSFDDRGKFLPGNIGAAFRYKIDKGGKKPDALIPLEYRPGEKGGNKIFSFDITDAGLVLFVSGVGFFWYDISPLTDKTGNSPEMDEDIRFISCFKELNYKKNTKIFVRRDGDTVFTVGDWTAELVTNACPGATFFAERKNALSRDGQGIPVPDKALLFQYGAYDEAEVRKKDLEEAAYHLSKGYSKAYKIPEDFGKHTLKPFSNVLWYATREGVGYYALATHDDRQFFIRDMPRNFMRDYFLLYVLALHEQYTILRFAERMAEELPADPHTYLPSEMYLDVLGENENDVTEILDIERKVMRLSTEINVFFAKSVRSSVSFVDHQDRFFRYILKSLRVVQDTDMIMRGLSAIQMLLKDVMRQEESFDDGDAAASWRREKEYQKLEKEKELLISELYHDTTTGLYNKTALMHYGRRLYTEAREQGKALFV